MSEFKATASTEGNHLILTLEGMIDEDVSFPSIDTGKYAQVTINLKGIKTINSVGIREWLNWVRPISEQSAIVLDECPKAMVFQFNMVEGFLPAKARVSSFFVPYYCEKCDKEENVLFAIGKDIVASGGSVTTNFDATKAGLCAEPKCEMEMDVTEAKYFQFLKRTSS